MKDVSRYHFINVMKSTKDFLGEHLTPLTENDCTMLCSQTAIVDSINAALVAAGIEGVKIQLNWSPDQGSTWVQYPKSH